MSSSTHLPGVEQVIKSVTELEEDEWDRVIDINLKGVVLSMTSKTPSTARWPVAGAPRVGRRCATAP
ncbi:hypothetical protein [Sorangium sp. So ce1182]|uniref:hypothetical protein n=1 Tax=Sorangium sp. So ce1182 TaxID=3133334 RepID=UPI003F5DC10A